MTQGVDKKTLIFFFAFPVLSGKFGKQSLRFRAAKTFFFGITVFLYQNQNPVLHMEDWKQFYASLKPSKSSYEFPNSNTPLWMHFSLGSLSKNKMECLISTAQLRLGSCNLNCPTKARQLQSL